LFRNQGKTGAARKRQAIAVWPAILKQTRYPGIDIVREQALRGGVAIGIGLKKSGVRRIWHAI
jgi:hypothetical protein